jgi:hypothetical protein
LPSQRLTNALGRARASIASTTLLVKMQLRSLHALVAQPSSAQLVRCANRLQAQQCTASTASTVSMINRPANTASRAETSPTFTRALRVPFLEVKAPCAQRERSAHPTEVARSSASTVTRALTSKAARTALTRIRRNITRVPRTTPSSYTRTVQATFTARSDQRASGVLPSSAITKLRKLLATKRNQPGSIKYVRIIIIKSAQLVKTVHCM